MISNKTLVMELAASGQASSSLAQKDMHLLPITAWTRTSL